MAAATDQARVDKEPLVLVAIPPKARGTALRFTMVRGLVGFVAVNISSTTQSGGPCANSAAGVGWSRSVRHGIPVWIAPSWATDLIPLVGR